MNVGKRIQDLRQARDWGTHELSMASRVPVPTIHRIENGTIKNPGIDKVIAIARALDVTVSELLGEAPPDTTQARDIERTVMGLRVPNPRAFLAKLAGALENELRLVELMLDGFVENRQGGSGNHNSGGSFIKERIERGIRTAPADKN